MSGGLLTIDLGAIAANWRLLHSRLAQGCECAAVVKADAYGLGMAPVAGRLWSAGCRSFFVAHPGEGVALRAILPDAVIHVLNGLESGSENTYVENRLLPVLGSLSEIAAWGEQARIRGGELDAGLHFDTAMARLGLPRVEADALLADPSLLAGLNVSLVVSHLASADEAESRLNHRQLEAFGRIAAAFPRARRSLANSAGIFLGREYHFDMVRPGAALYGINPTPGRINPMRQVVGLRAKILQVRDVDAGESVGYGATWRAEGPSRIATVAVGYGDGFPRSLGNLGEAFIGQHRAPIAGRVSMDLITLDVTEIPAHLVRPGVMADLISPLNPVDRVAEVAGTIGYEILCGLKGRYDRVYLDGGVD